MKIAPLCILALAALSQPASAKDESEFSEDGLTITSGDLELNLGGRLHLDGAVIDFPDEGSTDETRFDVRRARLELSGAIASDIRFRVDREFAGNAPGWRNVWLSWRPSDSIEITGGNFTVPFSMEMLQSSNSMPFAERSLASALAPNFGLGGSVAAHGDGWTAEAGFFGKALGDENGSAGDRGRGLVMRVTAAPYDRKRVLLHLGAGFERRDFAAGDSLRFSGDPGSSFASNLMSSGTLDAPQSLASWNGEIAGTTGSVLVRAEAIKTTIEQLGQNEVRFGGQTIQASWMVTGERYRYSDRSGVFSGPRIKRREIALELAARFSRLDLDDDAVQRGIGQAFTVGANVYLARFIRIMADYTSSHVNRLDPALDVKSRVGLARFQIDF